MTDLLSLANSIKSTKEQIRQTLIARGVACPESAKFSTYPAKIDLLGRVQGTGTPTDEAEILTVKNNTGASVGPGDKVFLYCAENPDDVVKKEFSGPGTYSYSYCIVSRTGDKVLLPYTRILYNVAEETTEGSGYTNNDYNHYIIYYMSNNVIAYSTSSNSYIMFPTQCTKNNLIPIRKDYFLMNKGGEEYRVAKYNCLTDEITEYSGNCYVNLNGCRNFFILGNTFYISPYYSSWGKGKKFVIDDQNQTLEEGVEWSDNPNIYGDKTCNSVIGVTSDERFVFMTSSESRYLNIFELNNGSLRYIDNVLPICPELVPYYNSSREAHFSYNEFTNSLCVIEANKFLVFKYSSGHFELFFDKTLDFSGNLYAPNVDDNLTVLCGSGGYSNWFFYKVPSLAGTGYQASNPTTSKYSSDMVTGIVKVGGAHGDNIQVIIPRFPTANLTVTTTVDNATIESL